MKLTIFTKLMGLAFALSLFVGCQENEPIEFNPENSISIEKSTLHAKSKSNRGFVHGIIIELDGDEYYFAGPADGPKGERDVPGHYWNMAGKKQVVGKHYNTGPNNTGKFWSSTADEGAYLYTVHGIIDIWTPELAEEYFSKGYVHRHEFVRVSDGAFHPTKVIWLKHTAVTHFTFDGGPGAGVTDHEVSPGIDWEFPNNYNMPFPEPEI